MDYNSLSDEDLVALADKNYEALSDEGLLFLTNSSKRDTTYGEDFQIGLNSALKAPLKFAGLMGGGMASAIGATDYADRIYGGMNQMSADLDEALIPKDAQQSFGGKAIGTIATLPAQLAAFPFSPASTGTELLDSGEQLGDAVGGTLIDTGMNSLGAVLPAKIGGGLLKKFVSGALINAGQETATSHLISNRAQTKEGKEKFEPSWEKAGLAAIVGGPMGALSPNARKPLLKEGEEKAPAQERDTTHDLRTNNYNPSEAELQLLKQTYKNSTASLDRINQTEQELTQLYTDSPQNAKEILAELQTLQEHKARVEETLKELDKIFDDPTQIPDSTLQDIRLMREGRKVSKQVPQNTNKYPNQEPVSRSLDETSAIDDGIARADGLTDPVNISKRATETSESITKTSPAEIALTKIGEAMSEAPEKVQVRLERALDTLEALHKESEGGNVPGEHYSALRAALEQEVSAYKDILSGRKPDLNAGKKEVVSEPVTPEIPQHILDRDAALDRGSLEPHAARRGMSDDQYTQMLNEKYGLPESVRTEWDISETIPRDPIEIGDKLIDPETPEPTTRTGAQALQHHQYQLNKLSSILDNVTKQLKAYQDGLLPSGTFDVAKAEGIRKSLENQIEHHSQAIENVLRNSPELRDKRNKTVESHKAAESTKEQVVKVESVAEAIAKHINNLAQVFSDNLNLFSHLKDSSVYFDKKIPVELQRVMRHLVNVVGLNKDKIFFVDSTTNQSARIKHYGNTTVIHINRAALAELYGNTTFGTIRAAAHELGHLLFNKYLQSTITHIEQLKVLDAAFDKYKATNKLQPNFHKDTVGLVESQKYFHEFFAERVVRELVYNHALGAFASRSKYLVGFSKLISESISALRKAKISISKTNFVDELVQGVIQNNEASIKATGQTIFEKLRTERNDQRLLGNYKESNESFEYKTLAEVRNTVAEMGWTKPNRVSDDMAITSQKHDVVPFSRRLLDALGMGSTKLASKFFGKSGLYEVLKDNPIISQVYWHIRDAEQKAEKISNNLWFGVTDHAAMAKAGFITRMSKLKAETSAYMVVKNSKSDDMAKVHDIFREGFEQGLEYAETLQNNASAMTPEQIKIFKTLSELFAHQYEETVKVQQNLDKKNILPRRAGWYPSVRMGDYFVDISFNGLPAHRQHFRTPAEGRAFVQSLGEGTTKYLDVTDVMPVDKTGNANQFLFDTVDIVQRIIENKFPQGSGDVNKVIDNAMLRMIERGGKLGKHHQKRMNLSGYKGSELFASDAERGASFKEAIQASVADYTGSLRKMMINHHTDPILKLGDLAQTHPSTHAAATQMVDSALNRVTNHMQGFDVALRNSVDAIAKSVVDVAGGEFKPTKPVFDSTKNAVLEAFYLMKIMAKPAFAVGQVISTPVQALHAMTRVNGLKAYVSFGKGMFKLATNNPELRSSLDRVSQNTNTFEPQFIEALHLNQTDSKLLNGIKKYVFLNRLNEVADSFSRVLTYSAMYENYRAEGHSTFDAERLAMQGTDSTMVAYTRAEQAPVFQHMGIAGEMARPLQTFGQQQLANVIADIRHFETMHPSTWVPLLTYGLMSTLVGGAVSAMFMQEYELIRRYLNRKFPEHRLPSILDMVAHDDSFMDRILPDSNVAREAVLYGLPSITGIDLASSTRANETFGTLVGSVLLAEKNWNEMFPLLTFAGDTVSGVVTLTSEAMGNTHQSGELRKATQQALPVGPIAYGANELMGVNTTKIAGENTNKIAVGKDGSALMDRTPTDITAGLLGTKSTKERHITQQAYQDSQEDKERKANIQRLASLAVQTGDKKYVEKLATYGLNGDQLQSLLSGDVYNKLVDMQIRTITNKQGNVVDNPETARKAKRLFNFRGSNE